VAALAPPRLEHLWHKRNRGQHPGNKAEQRRQRHVDSFSIFDLALALSKLARPLYLKTVAGKCSERMKAEQLFARFVLIGIAAWRQRQKRIEDRFPLLLTHCRKLDAP
jgi:hypothetical protein